MARSEHWTPLLREVRQKVYGWVTDVDDLVADAAAIATEGARRRRPALRMLDLERETDPAWFHDPSTIGYVAYAELFVGTLKVVEQRLDYLQRSARALLPPDEGAACT